MKKVIIPILCLSAPLSWLLLPLIAIPMSMGSDGGWSGLFGMYLALALILLTHLICPLGLLLALGVRIRNKQNIGIGLVLALVYYVVILGFIMLTAGLSEFWRDASSLLSGLFN